MGTAFSVAGTLYTTNEWFQGNAAWYDVVVSAGLTAVGFIPFPVTIIGSDVAMLVYDIISAESQNKTEPNPCK